MTDGDGAHAVLLCVPCDLWHPRHLLDKLRAAEARVQDHHMERIDQVLVVLQPVARDDLRAAAADAVVDDGAAEGMRSSLLV